MTLAVKTAKREAAKAILDLANSRLVEGMNFGKASDHFSYGVALHLLYLALEQLRMGNERA